MKYFTLESWIKDQDTNAPDDECVERNVRARREYEAYLANIWSRLPSAYQKLRNEVVIHDGSVFNIDVDLSRRQVILTLKAFNSDLTESRLLQLRYRGVHSFSSSADPEKGLPGPFGYGDLGVDEIELLKEGLYEHRMLFSSGIELTIAFEGLDVEKKQN